MIEAILTRNNEPKDTESAALPQQLPDMIGVAQNALTWGLELCAEGLGLDGPEAAVYHLQQGDDIAHALCCYGIAQQIAESLGSWDEDVRAVYTLDYDTAPESLYLVHPLDYEATPNGPYPGEWTHDAPLIHLLVWTQHRTTALDSLAADLDRALVQVYSDTIGTPGLTNLLNLQVIDDAHVEQHVCSGELYNWLYLRPIRLWKR